MKSDDSRPRGEREVLINPGSLLTQKPRGTWNRPSGIESPLFPEVRVRIKTLSGSAVETFVERLEIEVQTSSSKWLRGAQPECDAHRRASVGWEGLGFNLRL